MLPNRRLFDLDLGGLEEGYVFFNLLGWLFFCVAFWIAGRRAGLGRALRVSAVVLSFVSMALLARITCFVLLYGLTSAAWAGALDPEKGGMWGGPLWFVVLMAAALWVLERPRFWPGLDAFALTLPPTFALSKLACFAAGCCHGAPTQLPWGLVFPDGTTCTLPGVPLHPTQLYDALGLLAIGGLLLAIRARLARTPGLLFGVFGLAYVTLRFGTETLRHGDYFMVPAVGLHLTQMLELAAAVLLVGLIYWRLRATTARHRVRCGHTHRR